MKNIFYVLLTFLFLSGCKGTLQKPKRTQEINLNFLYSPHFLDPRKSTEPTTCVLNMMLYEGLMYLESDGTVSPALAKNVKISKDRKSYCFTLRSSCWSDGSPLTAYDFESSWKFSLRPEFVSRGSHLLFLLENGKKARRGECSIEEVGVKAVDDHTLVVKLERPTPYFLELVSYPMYFPVPSQKEVAICFPVSHQKEVTIPSNGERLVTNGPFVLTLWENDAKITVEKNPHFWNADEVKLDKINISIVGSEITALQLFKQGKIDWIGTPITTLPLDAVENLKSKGLLKKRSIVGTTFFVFNTQRYPFHNLNIRKAFAYAVNRKELVENVDDVGNIVALGLIPPILKGGRNPELFPDHQEKLAQLHFNLGLKELNITKEEFPSLTYQYYSAEINKRFASILQAQWRKVLGVKVQLESPEIKTHLNNLRKGNFTFAQMSWISQFFDQMDYLDRLKTKDAFRNYSNWTSHNFYDLLEKSYDVEVEERELIFERAEKIIMEELPMFPFCHYLATYVCNPKLKGVKISPIGTLQFRSAYLDP